MSVSHECLYQVVAEMTGNGKTVTDFTGRQTSGSVAKFHI